MTANPSVIVATVGSWFYYCMEQSQEWRHCWFKASRGCVEPHVANSSVCPFPFPACYLTNISCRTLFLEARSRVLWHWSNTPNVILQLFRPNFICTLYDGRNGNKLG